LFERSIPRFVDILPSTLCIDPEKVESAITSKTKAILAVDVFGHPADWDALGHLARKYGLHLIEDACESLGSKYKGKLCGTFGDCAVFAFYPNKQMTTGEGGMIVTKREEIARISRSLRNQGRSEGDQWLVHERLGYNYRLSDLSCALGISQLSRIDEILKKRSVVALYYNEILSDFGEFVSVPLVQKEAEISWFVYVVRLSDDFSQADRDEVLRILRAKGIGCSNYFPPIHVQPFYKTTFGYKPGDFPIAEAIASRTIALPFFSSLSRSNAEFVCGELREAIAKLKANRHE
jgi:perosamine synthetase